MLALGRSYVALKTSVKLRKLGLRASVDENRPHPYQLRNHGRGASIAQQFNSLVIA